MPPKTTKEEISINTADLEKLLTQVIVFTKDCSAGKLTELYVRLEKKILSFRNEWDRSSLPQVCCYSSSKSLSEVIECKGD